MAERETSFEEEQELEAMDPQAEGEPDTEAHGSRIGPPTPGYTPGPPGDST